MAEPWLCRLGVEVVAALVRRDAGRDACPTVFVGFCERDLERDRAKDEER